VEAQSEPDDQHVDMDSCGNNLDNWFYVLYMFRSSLTRVWRGLIPLSHRWASAGRADFVQSWQDREPVFWACHYAM
jgi:hypothetical protein